MKEMKVEYDENVKGIVKVTVRIGSVKYTQYVMAIPNVKKTGFRRRCT